MKAKVYAVLKFHWLTVLMIPKVLWLAVQSMYYNYKKNDAKLISIWRQVRHLEITRKQETIRVYRKYKFGYELTIEE